jgi:hypothetical protein
MMSKSSHISEILWTRKSDRLVWLITSSKCVSTCVARNPNQFLNWLQSKSHSNINHSKATRSQKGSRRNSEQLLQQGKQDLVKTQIQHRSKSNLNSRCGTPSRHGNTMDGTTSGSKRHSYKPCQNTCCF